LNSGSEFPSRSNANRAAGEERDPTEDETNHMIDEMRLRFYETCGEDAYNRAVSQAEREATADRLGRMNDLRLCIVFETC